MDTRSQAQFDKMEIIGNPVKIENEFVSARDVNGRICAAIKIISDMDGFKYDANNGVVKVEHKPGQDIVFLSPDERVLDIYKTGYSPLKIILSEVNIHLNPKEIWQINVKGNAKPSGLLPVTFLVQPADAKISIDNMPVQAGTAVELAVGTHDLFIYKEGFRSTAEKITVDKKNVFFNYQLKEVELQQTVFRSTPTGADIYINDVNKGQTEKGFFLYPGTYRVKIVKTGYSETIKEIRVTEGSPNNFQFNLSKNSGTLNLSLNPQDAEISINKEDYSGQTSIELAPGTYKLSISKTGYTSINETITMQLGSSLVKEYTLPAKTGQLQFTIQPLSASVRMIRDGKFIQSWEGMKYVKDLQVGTYTLECTASGCESETKYVTINENQTAVSDVKLLKGELTFAEQAAKTDMKIIRKKAGPASSEKNLSSPYSMLTFESTTMVLIKGGKFLMGEKIEKRNTIHQVVLDDFYMDKFELTQKNGVI